MNWNIAAECISTVILFIIWIYSMQSHALPSMKNRLFQICFFVTFCAMTSNIASTLCIEYINVIPLWFSNLVTFIYFITTPLMGVAYFYYSLSIIYEDQPRISLWWSLSAIPAVIYLLLTLFNWHTGWLYSLNELGYARGPYIFTTYLVFYTYCFFTCAAVLLFGKRLDLVIRNILVVFPLVAALVVIIQLLVPSIVLSGSAATCALLILYLYLQNKQISIDYLLNIPNHKEFLNALQLRLKHHKELPFTIIIISLRNFKQVNDTYGQHNGDEFLKVISSYLRMIMKPYQLYRYNGDEFAVLVPNFDKETIERLIRELEARMRQPWNLRDFSCMINSVFGIVSYPESAESREDLINALEYTVSTAKEGKEGSVCYCSSGMLDDLKRRYKVIDILKDALAHDKFQVYYQPIWSVKEKRFTLAESLLRLPESPLGPLYPSEFIPLAEETGLIVEITYHVLDSVCRFIKELLDAGTGLESITVNFSAVQFSQHNLADKVFTIIERNEIPYHMIKIEITESVLAENKKVMEDFMEQMHQKGIQIGLDDFGTGYCNLVSVLNMAVDVVKIDKSILWSSMKNEKSAIMMRSLIRSVRELGMRVVTEGVETKEQEDFVIECGCDWIQGFLYAKPIPGQQVMDYLQCPPCR